MGFALEISKQRAATGLRVRPARVVLAAGVQAAGWLQHDLDAGNEEP